MNAQEGTAKFAGIREETTVDPAAQEALVRELLTRIADKWTLLVVDALETEELRFSQLRAKLGGVSQKMLTKTLRQLERDGLVTRRVTPTTPPRVDYALTPLGLSLGETVCSLWLWVDAHMHDVHRSRAAFDGAVEERRGAAG